MDYPELDPDESIMLQSRNVRYKSISFDAILTGKRIHLTDNKNNIIPSQDIILATLRKVETGENAIRDHFLTLSLVTDAGEKHQVVLTFAKQAGAERKRECHEWAKKLNYLIPPSTPVIAPFTGPAVDKEQATKREVPRPPQEAAISTHPARKKRDIISPNQPVIEKSPGNSKSRATPPHLFPPFFCSGCGNRVAPDTSFCNHCGAPIELPPRSGPGPQPVKSVSTVSVPSREPEPVVTKVKVTIQTPSPDPVTVKGEETVQSQADSTEKRQDSSIEEIVLPIKLPIEESAALTMQYPPLVQQQISPLRSETSSPEFPAPSSPEGGLPVFPEVESPAVPSKKAAPAVPESPPPPRIPAPGRKKPNYRAIGILVLAILPILVGLVIMGNIIFGPHGGLVNTTPAIPSATPIRTQLPQTLAPSITVTSPNGGENLERGTSHTITWNYTGDFGPMVKIVLFKSGSDVGTISYYVSTGSGGKGSFLWEISSDGTTGSDYKVSVQSINQPAIEDISNDYFTLTSETTASVLKGNTTNEKKGMLNVTIGDYPYELPVFIDNKSAGVVSVSKVLNVTTNVGQHKVRVCIVALCNNQDVMVLSSSPTTVDFGDWLKNDVVTGPLTVSIGGYDAELPVVIDNVTVGNVSQGKPLSLMASEGNHSVKVCVGILCVNETVGVKFAQPSYIDFGSQLKKIAEFPTPAVQIVDIRQDGAKVTVDLEFINPSKNDLTFTTTVQCAYSYIDPQTDWRTGNAKQITVTRTVRAGTRAKQSSDIWLSGGRSFIIELPQILNVTTSM
jgi:hypothetical protein